MFRGYTLRNIDQQGLTKSTEIAHLTSQDIHAGISFSFDCSLGPVLLRVRVLSAGDKGRFVEARNNMEGGTNGDLLTPRPRVLVPEKLSPDGLALLRSTLDVDERKGLSADELLDIIGQYDALLIRSETKVTAPVLQAAKKLKVVARAGVGVDNVDVKAATQLGIIVVNSPSGNIGAAAEHTIALLMALARNISDACASLKDKKWERSRLVGVEVTGKTLGIIGLGKG